jgi:RimJ/RimL family protein N-acetyltransferase
MILREGTHADIPFVMQTERIAGYDQFIGRWDEAQHAAELAHPGSRYLLAEQARAPLAFAILQGLDDAAGNIYLQRIAVSEQGKGDGAWLVRAVQDWVFARPEAHRLCLHFSVENLRGQRLYDRAGFVSEGLEREVYKMPDGRRVSRHLVSILRPEWRRLRGM